MRISKGEKAFYICNTAFLVLMAVVCIMPMVHIFAISLSSNTLVTKGEVFFWPKDFTLRAYEYIVSNSLFWGSFRISVVRLVLGVALQVLVTLLAAYPLSKTDARFRGRTFWAWFVFIPMLFSGGVIPWYLVISRLGMTGSIWALILPCAVSPFYVLLMLNFFRGLPSEIEEAALIDGAGQYRILFQIYLPLSLPSIATIAVYSLLGHWNSWFDGLLLMNRPQEYPLMTYLQAMVVNIDRMNLSEQEIIRIAQLGERTNRAAQVFVANVPIMIVYPIFQKYFTKGLTIGAVKG